MFDTVHPLKRVRETCMCTLNRETIQWRHAFVCYVILLYHIEDIFPNQSSPISFYYGLFKRLVRIHK